MEKKIVGNIDDVAQSGINFSNKRNWDKKEDDKVKEIKEEPKEPEIDAEYNARQKRLEEKLVAAKAINYSGFVFNGSSILIMVVGVHQVIMDPNTIEFINLIETTFGIEIQYERFIELIELWKTHLISLCGSVQLGFMYYQQTRQKMKDMDREDLFGFINDELNEVI